MTPDPRCGTPAGYQAHADRDETACQSCKTAQADYQRNYRARLYLARGPLKVDSTGTRRRLQALARIGWTYEHIGDLLGVTGSAVSSWTRHKMVRRSTARQVVEVYDLLSMTPGPSRKTAGRARNLGWPPPLAFDDDEIDDPAARPRHRTPNPAPGRPRNTDRDQRIWELTRAGLSSAEIAVRLRTTKRQVERARARYRSGEAVA